MGTRACPNLPPTPRCNLPPARFHAPAFLCTCADTRADTLDTNHGAYPGRSTVQGDCSRYLEPVLVIKRSTSRGWRKIEHIHSLTEIPEQEISRHPERGRSRSFTLSRTLVWSLTHASAPVRWLKASFGHHVEVPVAPGNRDYHLKHTNRRVWSTTCREITY